MKTIAIITARGGSKRIPHKNIKVFIDKPILAYSIEAAEAAGCFDEIMVSTDDEEIARIAKQYGAKVPFMRSAANSNDYAATRDVVREVLEQYSRMGQEYTHACCLYPTAPFVTGERLREGMKLLREQEVDSVLPIVAFSFPPQRCFVLEDGKVAYKWPEHAFTRSQDLEPYYHDCGQFYCMNVAAFMEQNVIIMNNTVPVILSEMEVQDIDTEMDWKLAELKYSMLHGKS